MKSGEASGWRQEPTKFVQFWAWRKATSVIWRIACLRVVAARHGLSLPCSGHAAHVMRLAADTAHAIQKADARVASRCYRLARASGAVPDDARQAQRHDRGGVGSGRESDRR